MNDIKTFGQLKKYVASQDGVVTVDMARLRAIKGAERLGNEVRKEIQRELERNGLGFLPAVGDEPELPRYSEELVRLYVRGSTVGRFIEALNDLGADSDKRLRALSGQAAAKLEKIKELLDD